MIWYIYMHKGRMAMNLEKQKRFLTQAAFYGVIALLVYAGLKYLLPTMLPFLLAFLIVWLLRRAALPLAAKLHLSPKYTLLALLVVFYITLFGSVTLAGAQLAELIKNTLPKLPQLYRDELLPGLKWGYHFIEETLQRFDPAMESALDSALTQLSATIENGLRSFATVAVAWASTAAMGVPSFIIALVLMITSSFFLGNDYDRVMNFLYSCLPAKGKERVREIWHKLTGSLWIYIRSYTLFLLITFVELNIGLHLLKIPYAGVIAASIAIFDLMPILGTGGILIPWTVIAAVVGNYRMALGIGVLYIVITMVRNYLEPKLVGKQIGLHPLATLIALFVGSRLFGLAGLFGFPVALSVIVQIRHSRAAAHIPSDQPKL